MSTEDMSRVKHSFGDGPLVPPSDLEFLYSPSAATCGSYVHTLQKTKTLSESTVITWRIPKGRTQATSYTKKKEKPEAENPGEPCDRQK